MNDERHSYYTCVPLRSIEAIVPPDAAERLDLILRALIVEPEEAEDLSEDPSIIDCSAERFVERGAMSVDAALQTIGQWSLRQSSVLTAIQWISLWNQWLGIWCASCVVRNLAQKFPRYSSDHLALIESTQDAVRDRLVHMLTETWKLKEKCSNLADDAYDEGDYSYMNQLDAAIQMFNAIEARPIGSRPSPKSISDMTLCLKRAVECSVQIDVSLGRSGRGQKFAELVRDIPAACMSFPR